MFHKYGITSFFLYLQRAVKNLNLYYFDYMSFLTLNSFKNESAQIARLGIPITIAHMGIIFQGLADTIMLGRYSSSHLAAAGFVNGLFLLGILLNLGFSMGSISQIGKRYSLNRTSEMVSLLKSCLIANFAQCLLLTVAMVGLLLSLPYLGQPVELLHLMRQYLLILIPSLPLFSFMNGAKHFFDSINDTRVSMWILIGGNIWNILFNYLLIFGKMGFPELGIAGAAVATVSARVLMLIAFILVFIFNRRYKKYRKVWRVSPATRRHVFLLNRLGWPIAIQLGLESASFSLLSIMLGWIGATALASHQVMHTLSGIVLMFYLGIGEAVSIKVSNYKGLGNMEGVRNVSNTGFVMTFIIGVVLSSALFLTRNRLGYVFTDNVDVAGTVAAMIFPMVLYQLGDGLQINYSNALRGLGDVRMLMRYSILAYIVISLPLSYLFGIVYDGGAPGVWMGLPFGLTTAGILYFFRFRKVSRISRNR